jgi:DNA repair protein RadD
MNLRDYQLGAVAALRASFQRYRASLLVSPPGSGKTVILGEIIRSSLALGTCTLFLAHRKELIDQVSKRLDSVGVDHGVIMAGHPRLVPWAPVQVASIPTLSSRLSRGDALPHAELVVIDEAHHARATTYGNILAAYPEASVLGATATPWRMDGRGLGEIFEDIVVAARPRELIDRGYLVPYTGFAYAAPDTSAVRKRSGDYEQEGLELVMSEPAIVGNIVQQYQQHAAGLRAVLFATSIKHSLDLVERFKASGVAAEHLDGETPLDAREATLERIRTGQTHVLCNVGIVTEGWDCPELEVCILARPTLSAGLYLQMVGRVMRPSPGKTVARIHDHAGCIVQHGAPDMDRDYQLDPDVRAFKSVKLPPLRTCKACFAIFAASAGPACPACDHVNPPAERELREIDGPNVRAIPLSELPQFKHASEETKRDHYERLVAAAREKGHRPGAAAMKFRAIYGRWPGAWRYAIERGAEVSA